MKDLRIKGSIVERELFVLLGCTIFAFGVAIYSLIVYNSNWLEFFTSLHYTLLLALVIYAIAGILRLIGIGILRLFKKPSPDKA